MRSPFKLTPRAICPARLLSKALPLALAASGTSLALAAAPQQGLFFSEYVEGGGNDKAVEIYNGSAATVDLSNYNLVAWQNGASTPSYTSSLSGLLAPYEVVVVVKSQAANIIAELNSRGVGYLTASAINFNGDDTIALAEAGAAGYLDVIGQIGTDPGSYFGSNPVTTKDDTLRRFGSVRSGDTNGTDSFDPGTEFTGFPKNEFGGLGEHTGPIDVIVDYAPTNHSGGFAATLGASGSRIVADNNLSLTVEGLPTTGTTAYLFNSFLAAGQSLSTVSSPTPGGGPAAGGDVCIAGGTFGRHVFGSDIYVGTAGTFTISLDLTDLPSPRDGVSFPNPGHYSTAVLAGETWYWQCWYRDPSAGTGASNFTQAIGVTFQ